MERFEHARRRCEALVGKPFKSPQGKVGTFVGVLERPGERPPVVVGRLLGGQVMHFTPSRGESLVIDA